MPTDAEEVEQIAALVRAGLWVLFAAASIVRPEAHPATSMQEGAGRITEAAAIEADMLLDHFNARFPVEEMLSP